MLPSYPLQLKSGWDGMQTGKKYRGSIVCVRARTHTARVEGWMDGFNVRMIWQPISQE